MIETNPVNDNCRRGSMRNFNEIRNVASNSCGFSESQKMQIFFVQNFVLFWEWKFDKNKSHRLILGMRLNFIRQMIRTSYCRDWKIEFFWNFILIWKFTFRKRNRNLFHWGMMPIGSIWHFSINGADLHIVSFVHFPSADDNRRRVLQKKKSS